MTIYIVDNNLALINKDKIVKREFQSINKGYIENKEKFRDEYIRFLKEEKIKNRILNDKVEIVFNSYYRNSDKFYLESIFEDLGYLKIEFKELKDILDLDKAIYIEVNKNYMVINLDKGIYIDLDYFKDIPKILSIIDKINQKDIILFGSNKYISQIKLKDKMIYYIDKPESFLTESLLKAKKYGV